MPFEVGETIEFQPAVVFDDVSGYHMIFVSRDATNRLLYATSADGLHWEDAGDIDGQTTASGPAVAVYEGSSAAGPPSQRLLVVVFISNDGTKRLLYAVRNLDGGKPKAWKYVGQVAEESAHWVFADGPLAGETTAIHLYFVTNDDTKGLLETQFVPALTRVRG